VQRALYKIKTTKTMGDKSPKSKSKDKKQKKVKQAAADKARKQGSSENPDKTD
jgi:hypothetical protein